MALGPGTVHETDGHRGGTIPRLRDRGPRDPPPAPLRAVLPRILVPAAPRAPRRTMGGCPDDGPVPGLVAGASRGDSLAALGDAGRRATRRIGGGAGVGLVQESRGAGQGAGTGLRPGRG